MSSAYRPRIVLASASPARQKLLQAAGIDAEVMVSGVDESAVDASNADALCSVLARLKAEAVASRLRRTTPASPAGGLVLGCDSVLELDGRVLGKPVDAAQAAEQWRGMRGRSGVLHSGHCLVDLADDRRAEAVAATTVRFAAVTDEEIDAYVATGEPLRVAGAFTIDGLGGPFVEGVVGDPGAVIGLSLPLLRRLLGELGVPITALWRAGLRPRLGPEAG